MKSSPHPAIVAFGLTTLILMVMYAGLVSPLHDEIYHLNGSATSIFIPVLINLAVFWLFATAVLLVAERPGLTRRIVWPALLLSLPWIIFKNANKIAGWDTPRIVSTLLFGVATLGFVLVQILWRPAIQSRVERVQRLAAVCLSFAAVGGLFTCVQILWFGWQARDLNVPRPLHQSHLTQPVPAGQPRVIWILLDELSYQQVYEQRFPGLELPNFDRLASESTVFTHVVPVGYFTEKVVPSLITGLTISHIRASPTGQLILHDELANRRLIFDPHNTVFQDAILSGYTTGVAGWYNPYCRILNPVLDRCYWNSHLILPGAMSGGAPLSTNILAPARKIGAILTYLLSRNQEISPSDQQETALHLAEYHELLAASDRLLADPFAGFIFLHLPIPHPPGIYDRQHGTFTTGRSSYIQNLALADLYLAHLRAILQQQGQWDSSLIVVMGDHSWRDAGMWSKTSHWSAEDQAASHGAHFDDRPAYIVKLPNQHSPARIDQPFEAIRTRALFHAILTQHIDDPATLARWAAQ
jgi:hypothetical protein